MRPAVVVLVVVALALALAGCAGLGSRSVGPASTGPGAGPPTSVPAGVRQAARTHEVPSPPAPTEHADRSAASAVAAVHAYAERYINWNAGTVTAMLSELARASIGQARSAMALEAAQVASDPALAQNGIANSGTVEAVAPLRAAATRYAVVTLERTTAALSDTYQGLRPAWHVTIATVAEVASGQWVVSGWQPEN